jgi:DNA-binding GntR family transcriptional regulator
MFPAPLSNEIAEVDALGRIRGGTVDRVFQHLKDGILSGRYAPGQRLIESDLTSELTVSRGPLREAFRKLSAEGLVESIPNRGAIVRRLSHKETQELFQIRGALEVLAARLASENIGMPGARERFEQAVAPIWNEAPRNIGMTYLGENRIFHQAVADISGNEQLAVLCRQMQLPLIMFQLSGMLTPETLALSNREHRAIAAAILAGDADAASARMTNHLERARRFADALPRTIFRPTE